MFTDFQGGEGQFGGGFCLSDLSLFSLNSVLCSRQFGQGSSTSKVSWGSPQQPTPHEEKTEK